MNLDIPTDRVTLVVLVPSLSPRIDPVGSLHHFLVPAIFIPPHMMRSPARMTGKESFPGRDDSLHHLTCQVVLGVPDHAFFACREIPSRGIGRGYRTVPEKLAGCAIVMGAVVLHGIVRSAGEKSVLDEPSLLVLWLLALSVPLAESVIASFVYLKRL